MSASRSAIYWPGSTSTAKMALTVRYTGRIILPMDGKELRKIRRSLSLTQGEMADRVGVRLNTVARWERDESKISEPVSRLIRLLAKMESKGKRNKPRR